MALVAATVAGLGAWSGCDRLTAKSAAPNEPPPALAVSVARPFVRTVAISKEFTGRVEAKEVVEVRARIKGTLTKMEIPEGDEVEEGDLLYEIEPPPYETSVAIAKAKVKRQEATVKRTLAEARRAENLRRRDAITSEDYDAAIANRDEAVASLDVFKAEQRQSEIDLGYTRVKAPIPGRISRTEVTIGNLVGQAEPTLLTTIIRQDPMYVYFDPNESDLLEYRTRQQAAGTVDAEVELADETALKGKIDFGDTQIDTATGTIRVRVEVNNPATGTGGDVRYRRPLIPGLFCKVRVPRGDPAPTVLVPDGVIQLDLAYKFVWVLDAENKARARPVVTGPMVEGLRVIEEGLTGEDLVIIDGLLRVRPGALVAPTEVPMPDTARDLAAKKAQAVTPPAAEKAKAKG